MAAGTLIQHKRKAGAFVGGDLAAGEFGVDTSSLIAYYSADGSTVLPLPAAGLSSDYIPAWSGTTFIDSTFYDGGSTQTIGPLGLDANIIIGGGSIEFGDTQTVSTGLVAEFNASAGTFTLTGVDVTASTFTGVWNGSTIPVTKGGTGRTTSTTAYGLIAAGTTAAGTHQTLAAGATTEILVGGGASALPVWTTATGTGAPVRAASPTLTGDIKGGTFNANGSTQPATPAYFYLSASSSFATNSAGADLYMNNTNAANNTLYGILATARQGVDRSASNGVIYGGKFQAQGAGNAETAYGLYGTLSVDSGKTIADGGAVLFGLSNSGTVTTFKGLNESFVNSGTISTFYGTYCRLINNGPITNFSGLKVELANSGSTITTAKGIEFDGYSVGSGITTNYLIYAGTSTSIGTTKYGLYFLPDMVSHHVGKFGIGSGNTAPSARLQVRDTSEQLRLDYNATNYFSQTVDSAANTTFALTASSGTPAFTFSNNLALTTKLTKYNNITTAGLGAPAIYSAPAQSATQTANFTVLTYTPPATAGTYRAFGVITTTSSTNTGTVQMTLDYRDSQGTVHTADILALQDAAGNIATTKSGASKEFHTVPYLFTINNAATNIVLKVVITGTVSYTVTGCIEQIN